MPQTFQLLWKTSQMILVKGLHSKSWMISSQSEKTTSSGTKGTKSTSTFSRSCTIPEAPCFSQAGNNFWNLTSASTPCRLCAKVKPIRNSSGRSQHLLACPSSTHTPSTFQQNSKSIKRCSDPSILKRFKWKAFFRSLRGSSPLRCLQIFWLKTTMS